MSEDLVKLCKRLSKYAHAQLSSADLERIANRIEELEAKLAKAVAFMNHVADGQSKDYTNNCDLARTTLAELKGQNDE